MEVKFKKIRDNAVTPKRATAGSAGFDLFVCTQEPITIKPGQLIKLPTGIAIAIESEEYAAFIFARSGLGIKHGITLSNGVGVVDSDYRGEIQIGLCNIGEEPYTVQPFDRIAQMIFMPVCAACLVQRQELPETKRGTGGLGSSGK